MQFIYQGSACVPLFLPVFVILIFLSCQFEKWRFFRSSPNNKKAHSRILVMCEIRLQWEHRCLHQPNLRGAHGGKRVTAHYFFFFGVPNLCGYCFNPITIYNTAWLLLIAYKSSVLHILSLFFQQTSWTENTKIHHSQGCKITLQVRRWEYWGIFHYGEVYN